MTTSQRPELYWISGSPPAWRVMLGLTLKGIAFVSRRLDHSAGENRAPAYLAVNPTGQVPTLRHGDVVVRESIAILAYLDRAWPKTPLFGETPGEAAAVWQAVMEFESDLRPPVTTIARSLLRGTSDDLSPAVVCLLDALDRLEADLEARPFLLGASPSAADCWLYPSLGWIDRAIAKSLAPVPSALNAYGVGRQNLTAWRRRFGAEPGVSATYPPHWANPPSP
jgi:glutathione S-transferase